MAKRVAVIGAGIFGCTAALRLREAGHDVTLFERADKIMTGASSYSHGRLHRGYHYPRSSETIRQCIRGARRFVEAFPGCVVDMPTGYFIHKSGSLTSFTRYVQVLRDHGLAATVIDPAAFALPVRNVSGGVAVDEGAYDAPKLAEFLSQRIERSGITLWTGREIEHIARRDGGVFVDDEVFDVVLNCTYGDVNRLTVKLGHAPRKLRYEYVAYLILEIPDAPRAAVAIMDSQIDGVMLAPRGPDGFFLLYHTALSVIAAEEAYQIDRAWCARQAFTSTPVWIDRMLDRAARCMPIIERARVVRVVQGPRMVPAASDVQDQRPSFVLGYASDYAVVHAGKVDHCLDTAEDVVSFVNGAGT